MESGNCVIKAMLAFPYTWVAVGTVIGAEGAFVAWFEPPATMLVVSGALCLGLLVGWWFLGTRSDAFVEHLYRAPDRRRQRVMIDLDGLRTDLHKAGSSQGTEQLALLGMKLETVREVLKQRLSSGELTFARYIGVAEQVYLNAIDNLREVYVALTAVSTIDAQYIDTRLAKLRGDQKAGQAQDREVEALEERKKLLEEQLEKVTNLIVDNEAMMTALDNTATKLADAKINGGHATMDAETAMSELVRLAVIAKKYKS